MPEIPIEVAMDSQIVELIDAIMEKEARLADLIAQHQNDQATKA